MTPKRVFGAPPQTGYRPGSQLVREVIAAHQTCRFPGCARPAGQCDLDHVIPYRGSETSSGSGKSPDGKSGGKTCSCNLFPVCRHHHKLKTHGGWQLHATDQETSHHAGQSHQPGTVQWTSPLGRTYLIPPDDQPGMPT